MPVPGMSIYACSEDELVDLLKYRHQFHKIEIGVVAEGEFGLGLNTEEGKPLFHSQLMDKALRDLKALERMMMVVFFTKDDGVVAPTEVAAIPRDLLDQIRKITAAAKEPDQRIYFDGPAWF